MNNNSLLYLADIGGFLDTLAELSFATEGKRVLMFGTGGAASGLIAAFQKGGFSQITVAGRNSDKLEALSSRNIETILIDNIKFFINISFLFKIDNLKINIEFDELGFFICVLYSSLRPLQPFIISQPKLKKFNTKPSIKTTAGFRCTMPS